MISRHHQPKNVVEAQYFCKKCGKSTMHRVDDGKKGPCLKCLEQRGPGHAESWRIDYGNSQRSLF